MLGSILGSLCFGETTLLRSTLQVPGDTVDGRSLHPAFATLRKLSVTPESFKVGFEFPRGAFSPSRTYT